MHVECGLPLWASSIPPFIRPINVEFLQYFPPFLPSLSRRDVRRFKDVRKEFERGSESLEGALVRNAQAPRGKQHEVEEASNALLNARRTFRAEALDYVLEVRENDDVKRPLVSGIWRRFGRTVADALTGTRGLCRIQRKGGLSPKGSGMISLIHSRSLETVSKFPFNLPQVKLNVSS